jgi:hypothetical protein
LLNDLLTANAPHLTWTLVSWWLGNVLVKRATEGFETGDFRRAAGLMARIDAA